MTTSQRSISFFLLLAWVPFRASSFHHLSRSRTKRTTTWTGLQQTPQDDNSWLHKGLLLSSFSDGLKPNEHAQNLLMNGLVKTLWRDRMATIEQQVEESALVSSCCGPTDIDSLNELLDGGNEDNKSWQDSLASLINVLQEGSELELRFLYIPTAMYALRQDSNNSAGKQRQRARADGKKRRNEVANLLTEKLGINVLSITLDFDDGSIKQPEGSEDASKFPTDGKEALTDWQPNLIYVQGGNTFWLYHCMEKGSWDEILISAVTGEEAAVYCGTSAGAILAGSSMATATWKGWDDPSVVPDRPTYGDWKNISGLSLAGDVSIFPHMGDQWQTMVNEKQAELDGTNVYCLRDEEVLYVDGGCRTVQLLSTATTTAPQGV